MTKKIERVYKFSEYYSRGFRDSPTDKIILVVGCGGTGGYLIPHLTRFASLVTKMRRGEMGVSRPDKVSIILIDGDQVEEKNLLRQNFIRSDIGKYKAEVLARRYSLAFGVDIHYYNGYLESRSDIERIITSTRSGVRGFNRKAIVVTCVDNNKTRKIVWNWFKQRSDIMNTFWIDSGNEEHHGQIVIGFKSAISPRSFLDMKERDPDGSNSCFSLPCYFEMFPNAFEDMGLLPAEEIERRISCAERAVENPQTIFVNMMAAQTLLNAMQSILKHDSITYHAAFFKTTSNQTRPVKLTHANIVAADDMIAGLDDKLRELDLYDIAHNSIRRRTPVGDEV